MLVSLSNLHPSALVYSTTQHSTALAKPTNPVHQSINHPNQPHPVQSSPVPPSVHPSRSPHPSTADQQQPLRAQAFFIPRPVPFPKVPVPHTYIARSVERSKITAPPRIARLLVPDTRGPRERRLARSQQRQSAPRPRAVARSCGIPALEPPIGGVEARGVMELIGAQERKGRQTDG